MKNLKQEIFYIEGKVIKSLYDALVEYQQKSGKDYFVIGEGNYVGVKHIDQLNEIYAIPVGSIYARNGQVRYAGKEDFLPPDFYHAIFDYDDIEHYKTLKKGDMILSEIYALYELVVSAV